MSDQELAGTSWVGPLRTTISRAILVISLALLVTGCAMTQSPFARVTSETGAEFAAAATTLQYLHERSLTRPYARSAFASYATAVEGADQQIMAAEGAPNPEVAQHLAELTREATVVVVDPCLDAVCGWRGQLLLLKQASSALRKASGG